MADFLDANGLNTYHQGVKGLIPKNVKDGSGTGSIVEGASTTASGERSHAEGQGTTASGNESHAEGYGTRAIGEYSHAEGLGTIANANYQHVFGKYNVEDATSIEIVGIGASSSDRSNARTLDGSGNEWLAGTINPVGGLILTSPNSTNYKFGVANDGKSISILDGSGTLVQTLCQELPSVSSTDDGKILKVSNGTWAKSGLSASDFASNELASLTFSQASSWTDGKSIKFENDTYLDARGVDGNKGTITSGDDLDNYWGPRKAGLWVVNTTRSEVANCPLSYSGLIVIAIGQSGAQQMIFNHTGIYYRDRTGSGSSIAWSTWRCILGREENIIDGFSMAASGSRSFSIQNNTRAVVHTMGLSNTLNGTYVVTCNGAGTPYIYSVVEATGVTITSGGANSNTITVQNGSSSTSLSATIDYYVGGISEQ